MTSVHTWARYASTGCLAADSLFGGARELAAPLGHLLVQGCGISILPSRLGCKEGPLAPPEDKSRMDRAALEALSQRRGRLGRSRAGL